MFQVKVCVTTPSFIIYLIPHASTSCFNEIYRNYSGTYESQYYANTQLIEGMCETEVDSLKIKSNRQRKENQSSTELWGNQLWVIPALLIYAGITGILLSQENKRTNEKLTKISHSGLSGTTALLPPSQLHCGPSVHSPSGASVTGGLKWSHWEERLLDDALAWVLTHG